MPCVGADHSPRRDFQNAQPDGHKHLCVVVLTQLAVDPLQHFLGGKTRLRGALDECLGDHHEQRRRHPFARHVCHDQRQVVVVHQKKVIEITAHFFCGRHGGIDVKLRIIGEGRENTGQHIRLDLCRHVQFRADSLFFGGYAGQIVDIQVQIHLHFLDGCRQVLDLIVGAYHGQLGADLRAVPDKAVRLLCDEVDWTDHVPIQIDHVQRDKYHRQRRRCQNGRKQVLPQSGFQRGHWRLDRNDGQYRAILVDHRQHGRGIVAVIALGYKLIV